MQISKTVEAQMFNVREAFKVLHLASCGPDCAGADGEVCPEFLELNAVLNSFQVANY